MAIMSAAQDNEEMKVFLNSPSCQILPAPTPLKKKKKKVFFAPLCLWSTVTVAHLSPILTFPPRSQLVLTGFSFWAAGKQLSKLHPLLPPPQRTHRLPPRLQVPRAA